MSEEQRLRRRAERERAARLEAEAIGERATRELYRMVQDLERSNRELEALRVALERQVEVLSVPVIRSWHGVATFPIVGTFDARRSARLTDVVLSLVAAERLRVVILETSGLAGADHEVAARLCAITAAVRLMGCRVLIVGLPEEAAIALAGAGAPKLFAVPCFARQSDALAFALESLGYQVTGGAPCTNRKR